MSTRDDNMSTFRGSCNINNINFDVVEMNPVSATIAKILYPDAKVTTGEFQEKFIDNGYREKTEKRISSCSLARIKEWFNRTNPWNKSKENSRKTTGKFNSNKRNKNGNTIEELVKEFEHDTYSLYNDKFIEEYEDFDISDTINSVKQEYDILKTKITGKKVAELCENDDFFKFFKDELKDVSDYKIDVKAELDPITQNLYRRYLG